MSGIAFFAILAYLLFRERVTKSQLVEYGWYLLCLVGAAAFLLISLK